MLSSPVMNVEMREPAMDFDCPTESEQADSSVRAMDSEIANALLQFQTDKTLVVNASKFQARKAKR